MTAINDTAPSLGIPIASLTRTDPGKLIKAPEEFVAHLREGEEMRYKVPLDPPDNAPENLFAEIRVGNDVIAKVYNSGLAELPNGVGNIDVNTGRQGPEAAQARAEKIAEVLGGKVVKAKTAQTQAEWNARPPRRWGIDYEAMERDRREVEESLRKRSAMSAAVRAQLLAQASD
ncbi:MAG TPA: hypothetical protein VD978_18480 [Azospirillum sp.]|nr:hypothetical protein [Azospirillum sp.]